MKETTLAAARILASMINSHRVTGCPIRYTRVIVAGPTNGYCVVELGFAVSNGLCIFR